MPGAAVVWKTRRTMEEDDNDAEEDAKAEAAADAEAEGDADADATMADTHVPRHPHREVERAAVTTMSGQWTTRAGTRAEKARRI